MRFMVMFSDLASCRILRITDRVCHLKFCCNVAVCVEQSLEYLDDLNDNVTLNVALRLFVSPIGYNTYPAVFTDVNGGTATQHEG